MIRIAAKALGSIVDIVGESIKNDSTHSNVVRMKREICTIGIATWWIGRLKTVTVPLEVSQRSVPKVLDGASSNPSYQPSSGEGGRIWRIPWGPNAALTKSSLDTFSFDPKRVVEYNSSAQ